MRLMNNIIEVFLYPRLN